MSGLGIRLLIATLALVLAGVLTAQAARADLVVNDDAVGPGPAGANCAAPDYATIQAAVNAAPAGSKVLVCAGSYQGATIEKEMTIEGAQAGVDAAERDAPPADESTVSASSGAIFDVSGGRDLIEGFRFLPGGATSGVKFEPGSSEGIIEDNTFSGFTKAVEGVFEKATLRHNLVESSRIGFESNSHPSAGTTVDGNRFVDTSTYDVGFLEGGTGIVVSRNRRNGGPGRFAVLFKSSQAQILENAVSEIGAPALYLGGDDLSPSVLRNSFTGVTDPQAGAISFARDAGFGANRRATIVGNVLTGNQNAITFSGSSAGSVFDIHFNQLVGNAIAGIVSEEGSDAAVDATNNWWGCNAGPGSAGCDAVSGDVDYDPWLILSLSASPTKIYEGTGISRLVADVNHNSSGLVAGSAFPNNVPIEFGTDLGSVLPLEDPTLGGRSGSTLAAGTVLGTAAPTAKLDNQVVSTTVGVVNFPEGAQGKTGEQGKTGAGSVALKRKMSAAFARPTAVVSGEKLTVELRCSGTTAQRCVGKVKIRIDGTFQRAVYAIARRRKAAVTLPGPVPDARPGSDTVRAVAVTAQVSGRPVKTVRKLKLRWATQ
jgi:Right handed beta helix region